MPNKPKQPELFEPGSASGGRSLDEMNEANKSGFRDHCKRSGQMGLYYSCYPGETPPGYFDEKTQERGRGGR